MKEEHRIIIECPNEIEKYKEYLNGGPMPNYFWFYIILSFIAGTIVGAFWCYTIIGGV